MRSIAGRVIQMVGIMMFFASAAQAGGPGTTSANFLKAGQGVRPIAMGETYIALGDGLDTLYWNPAGLVQLDAPSTSFTHSFWFQDIGTEYLAYGMPLGPLGAFGAGVTVLHAGTVTETLEDEYGNYNGTGEELHPMSYALVGTYAQKLGRIVPTGDPLLKNMLVGASLRLVVESLDDASVFGGALDLGLLWRQTEEITVKQISTAQGFSKMLQDKIMVRDNGWRAGFVAQNLGMTTDELMPMNFRFGGGYIAQDLFTSGGKGTVAVDVLVPIDNDVKVSIGTEYAYVTEHTQMSARVGYKAGAEIRDLDPLSGLTSGVGFSIKAGIISYQMDYAFVPYGELGATHRASLTLTFFAQDNAVPMSGQPGITPAEAPMPPGMIVSPFGGAVSGTPGE